MVLFLLSSSVDNSIEQLGFKAVFTLFASFFGILAFLAGLLILGWKRQAPMKRGSPYSTEPMILGIDIAKSLAQLIEDFMLTQPQPENAPFDITKAAICRTTGRIFPDCVTKGEVLQLGWNFIQKRHEGAYVSWGALSDEEKGRIKLLQDCDLSEFQLEDSCPRLLPMQIEERYKSVSPGPLYVDRMTGVLVGWKCVPGTHFEVLIVQKPKYRTIEETL